MKKSAIITAVLLLVLVAGTALVFASGKGCEKNLQTIGTALERYSTDNSGSYPATLDGIAEYLTDKTLPSCPDEGTYEYSVTDTYNAYTIYCSGSVHSGESYPENYPQYNSSVGLVTGLAPVPAPRESPEEAASPEPTVAPKPVATPTETLASTELKITTGEKLPRGTKGYMYSCPIKVEGGDTSGDGYGFSLKSGSSVPMGLELAASWLTGTPTAVGNFSFTVVVTDDSGTTAEHKFSLAIAESPTAPTPIPGAPSMPKLPTEPAEPAYDDPARVITTIDSEVITFKRLKELETKAQQFYSILPTYGFNSRDCKITGFKDDAMRDQYIKSLLDLEKIQGKFASSDRGSTAQSELFGSLGTHRDSYKDLFKQLKAFELCHDWNLVEILTT